MQLLDIIRRLQRDLADPPGDVQELVLRKLGLMGATVVEAFERGRQQGMDQERALWEMAKTSEPVSRPAACDIGYEDSANNVHQPAASSAQEPEICGKVVDWEAEHRRLRHENNKLRKANEKLRAAPARLAGAAQGESVAWADPGDLEDATGHFMVAARESRQYANQSRFTVPLYTHPQAQVERKPISHDQAVSLWHENAEAHRRESAFEWFAAGILACECHHGIPTASTASDDGSV